MQNAGISSVLASNAKYFMPNNDLKEGQIIVGKVNELAEDGTARIIINGKIITATVVEEALPKGKFYFEVKDFKDGKLELKVISEIKQNDQKSSIQILKELDIPFTKESDSIIKLFIQSERTFNKSEVLDAINQLVKSTNKQLTLDSISFLINKNYPISDKLVQTLMLASEEQLTMLLTNLDTLLMENKSNPTIKQLQSMIGLVKNNRLISTIQTEQNQLANQLIISGEGDNLLKQWNDQFSVKRFEKSLNFQQEVLSNLGKVAEKSPTVAKTLINILSELPEFQTMKLELSRIPMNLSNQLFANTTEQVDNVSQNPNGNQLNLINLKEIQDKVSTFLKSASTNSELRTFLLTNVLSTLNDNQNMNEMTKLFLQNQILNSSVDEPIIDLFKLIDQYHSINQELSTSEQLTKQFMKHEDLIGLNVENKINHLNSLNKASISEQFPTLKEFALKALNSNLPEAIKQPIEQLITKITAQQITSFHQNGPEIHITSTIPIFFNNCTTDLLIQWTGKEDSTNTKQIESNYCHILFFLELETLNETMVDVSIQNRIINVTIFNNNEKLSNLIPNALPIMKENLAENEFYLSSIKCLPFENEQKQKINEMKFNNSLLSSKEYTGVDVFV